MYGLTATSGARPHGFRSGGTHPDTSSPDAKCQAPALSEGYVRLDHSGPTIAVGRCTRSCSALQWVTGILVMWWDRFSDARTQIDLWCPPSWLSVRRDPAGIFRISFLWTGLMKMVTSHSDAAGSSRNPRHSRQNVQIRRTFDGGLDISVTYGLRCFSTCYESLDCRAQLVCGSHRVTGTGGRSGS